MSGNPYHEPSGSDHPGVAVKLNQLGIYYFFDKGDITKAEVSYKKALTSLENAFGQWISL